MSIHKKMPLSKEQLKLLICDLCDQSTIGIAVIDQNDSDLPFIFCNESFSVMTGFTTDELIGMNLKSLNGNKTDPEIEAEIEINLKCEIPFELNIIHYQKDGTPFWNNITSSPIRDETGKVQFTILYCKNSTDYMLDKMLAKLEREVYAELEHGDNSEFILQMISEKVEKYYTRNIYCSIRVLHSKSDLNILATGSIPQNFIHLINESIFEPKSGYSDNAVYIDNFSSHQNNRKFKELNITSCWSKPIVNQNKEILGNITIYLIGESALKQSDIEFLNKLSPIISLSLKYAEQKQELKRLAFFDMYTGIPNQNYFYTNLTDWLNRKKKGIVLIIQPGEYSEIVDLYGRKTGNQLFIQLVNRLNSKQLLTNQHDIIVGRFSNSSIILAKQTTEQDIDNFVNELRHLLTGKPYNLADRELFISLKIGVAHFGHGVAMDESIRQADIALTSARKKIGTVVTFFEEETDNQLQKEMDTLNQLVHGLQNNEFSAYLQPKVNLQSTQIIGFEALARWNSPILGFVSPAKFIPIAEYNGKIRDIDNAILRQVLQWLQQRKDRGLKLVPVSVNISPVHFYHDSFLDDFFSLISQFDISPEYIKIEVTENFRLVDLEKAKDKLLTLKAHGFESSIDDFGVGFSSLSYLQKLPFSEIKIDRSFVNNMINEEMFAIIQTIIELASKLKMHAVAEGIETFEQYKLLKSIGCHTGQGFYFHKPMPIDQAEQLLNDNK